MSMGWEINSVSLGVEGGGTGYIQDMARPQKGLACVASR